MLCCQMSTFRVFIDEIGKQAIIMIIGRKFDYCLLNKKNSMRKLYWFYKLIQSSYTFKSGKIDKIKNDKKREIEHEV